jgi:hypothetical protein
MMPSWSADGEFIYFVSRSQGNVQRLFKKSVRTGALTQMTFHAGGEAIEAPGGFPVYFSDGRNGIWQVSPGGGDERSIPTLETIRHRRYFAVTAKGLYFLNHDSPPWLISFYDLVSKRISRVTEMQKSPLYNMPSMAVSADDHWLLYGQADDGGSDILLVENFH